MIAGVAVEVGSEAVVVTSREPLRVVSSAVHLGAFARRGEPASGTSTDPVVIAATGRGARFGGPASPMGWVVVRATRGALGRAVAGGQERHR